MNPTPDIDIGELRKLEAAADAALNPRDEIMVMVALAERDYWFALRNAAPALLAKWEECERLKRVNALLQSSEQQYADENWRLKSRLAAAETVVEAARAFIDVHLNDDGDPRDPLRVAIRRYDAGGKSE